MAIISKANELLNDHVQRKKVQAEIKQIEADTQKSRAEAELIAANTRKTHVEAESIYVATQISLKENGLVNQLENNDQFVVTEVATCCEELKDAADRSGIRVDKRLEKVR